MNKGIIILLGCFMLLAYGIKGQPSLGITGGISLSKFSGDRPDKANYKRLAAFTAGVSLDLKLGKQLYLSIQPSFSQEGTRIFYNVPFVYDPVDSVHIRLNYISVPVILKAASNNQRFYAIGGVENAIMINSQLKTSTFKENIDDHVSAYNIAVIFGAGMRIPIGFPRLNIELRYKQGLVNLTGQSYAKSYIPRVKTSGFQLNIGLEIPLASRKNK